MRMPTDETDLAYLAGIFDGEGCIHLTPDHHRKSTRNRVMLTISNTDRELMDWLLGFGGSLASDGKDPRRSVQYRWRIAARSDVIDFLESILPYLRVKKSKAEIAIGFARSLIVD